VTVRALLDGGRLHHQTAMRWMASNARSGWVSCPLTQNGCVRILSAPSYPNAQPAAAVAERLVRATSHGDHVFWPDSISLLAAGPMRWDRVLTSRQVTDNCLLALAASQGARWVTFDRGISVDAVPWAQKKNLLALA